MTHTIPATRTDRTEKRNQCLRDAFYTRYTSLLQTKKASRENLVSQSAEEYSLSPKTVEWVLYSGGK